MKSWPRRWGFLLFVLCLPLPLSATLISYTMTGNVSGSLGGSSLTNAPFTFVFGGDTTGIYPWTTDPSILFNPSTSSSISIAGFGPGQFTEAVLVGVNPVQGIVGFVDANVSKGITFPNAGFIGWDLATPIGPFGSTTAGFASGSFSTDLGILSIAGAANLTFQATDAVPEPATVALIGAGLLLLGMLRRK